MAQGKSPEIPTGDLSEDEIAKLVKTLSAMKLKPKADTPAEFLQWMSSMVMIGQETGAIPKTPLKTEPTTPLFQSTMEYPSTWKPPLRISAFSGDGKGDTTYELWKYEVTCLMKEGHSREALMMAVRRSLKGEAATVLMRLGPDILVQDVIAKFDSIYGNVLETEDILAEFYSAKQKDTEDCAAWSMRLEDLINKAITKGKVSPASANEMLRTMFYKGLRQDLRDISGHLFHTISDFDRLRVAIRRLETEHKPAARPKQVTVKSASADDRFDKIQAQLNQLSEQVLMLNQPTMRNNTQPSQEYQSRPAYQRGKKYSKGRGWNRPNNSMSAYPENTDDMPQQQRSPDKKVTVCYKCGQEGHIAIGCRVRTDHRRSLNYSRPNPGAKDLARRKDGPSAKNN